MLKTLHLVSTPAVSSVHNKTIANHNANLKIQLTVAVHVQENMITFDNILHPSHVKWSQIIIV